MKILLVAPRYNYTNKADYSYSFPLGLGHVSSVLKDKGYDVACLNLNHCDGKVDDIINKILDSTEFDVICTGHMASGYIMIDTILNTAREHRSKPTTILGGPIVIAEPELMTKLLKPDIAIIGEGEITTAELLNTLKNKGDINQVKGIAYINKEGNVVLTEPRPVMENIDNLPYPDFEGFGYSTLLDNLSSNDVLNGMVDYPRPYPILCSRGCPYQCTFCYHPLGLKYRQRSIDSVMKELSENVRKYKINVVFLYDDLFSIDINRLNEFCERLSNLQKEVLWELNWFCQLSVNSVNEDMLKKLKDSGCCMVSYGFESASLKVLRSMKKPITPEKMVEVFRLNRKKKLAVQANFIFGDVAETMETADETLKAFADIFEGQVALGFIQPYPGSEIYKHCIRKGIIKDKLKFIKYGMSVGKPVYFNMTNNMTNKEFRILKRKIYSALINHTKFVHPLSFKEMEKGRYQIDIKCPFCGEIVIYKNMRILNKLTFVEFTACKKCGARFYVAGRLKFIVNKLYPFFKPLFDFYLDKKDIIKKNLV